MNKTYWDNLAENFEHDVFEVYKNDADGLIAKAIRKYASKEKIACDVGCGVGSLLPSLSKAFGKVKAIDLSPRCLQKAAQKCSEYSNITYLAEDLSSGICRLPRSDFSLCVNALIFPSLTGRIHFLDASVKALKREGVLLLVVPSFESALFRNHQEIHWNIKAGIQPQYAQRTHFDGIDGLSAKQINLGMVAIDGVETKHFLQEELVLMLEQRKMTVIDIQKIEYSWDTEFNEPPKWMGAP
jgi:2-polyprenyl-3-methyl-5-hydroxy-6-metoxy-1,4-benzoquinol methylase